MLPKPIQDFVEIFSRLPSLGPRAARRLAFQLLSLSPQTLASVERAFAELKNVDRCPRCFFIKEKGEKLCRICRDPKRDASSVAIVLRETDVLSLERAGTFTGTYLVLGEGRIGELGSAQKLRIKHLIRRIEKEAGGTAREIIIAVPPTSEGNILTEHLRMLLQKYARAVTRLGRGMPTGGEIEFADPETLKSALEGRK